MIECFGICYENCPAWQNGKCVLDAKKAEVIYDFETQKESAEGAFNEGRSVKRMDREKVTKGLEICTTRPCYCTDCPYKANCLLDSQELMKDALVLLNEDCHNCKLECLLQKYDELKEKYDALMKEQEVVRCKDCTYAIFKEGSVQHGHIFCTKPFTERWQAVKPDDWFCADGILKDS